jgi:hypothetical protein
VFKPKTGEVLVVDVKRSVTGEETDRLPKLLKACQTVQRQLEAEKVRIKTPRPVMIRYYRDSSSCPDWVVTRESVDKALGASVTSLLDEGLAYFLEEYQQRMRALIREIAEILDGKRGVVLEDVVPSGFYTAFGRTPHVEEPRP